MVFSRETRIYREDASKGGLLTAKQREDLAKPYLPDPMYTPTAQVPHRQNSRPVRTFLKTQVHILVYFVIHAIFSVYVRLRQTRHVILDRVLAILYYHHMAPELIRQDVKNLSRLPRHLSVILEWKGGDGGAVGVEALMDDVAEISAWCACVGIPMLSIYERTGITGSSSGF